MVTVKVINCQFVWFLLLKKKILYSSPCMNSIPTVTITSSTRTASQHPFSCSLVNLLLPCQEHFVLPFGNWYLEEDYSIHIFVCFCFLFFFFLIFEQAGVFFCLLVFLAKSKPDIFPKKNLFFVCVTNYENESNSDIVKRLSWSCKKNVRSNVRSMPSYS